MTERIEKVLVTGSSGTVGKALTRKLIERNHPVFTWDRTLIPPGNPAATERYLDRIQPDLLFHLAIASTPTGIQNESRIVNCEWPKLLAEQSFRRNIRFVFTSTVMVFSSKSTGPFTPDSIPDETEGYGYEKRIAEEFVRQANPDSAIVRLGWQIGDSPGSNNMIDFLENTMRSHKLISASCKWLPACSFLSDTADALLSLGRRGLKGTFHLDSNTRWSFFDIASALNRQRNYPWQVVKTEDFVFDQRMLDPRITLPSLETHLRLA